MASMKVVAQNRRARYDYEIVDTVEAGIMLTGQEVKSCRMGNVNLGGAYVSLLTGDPILKNANIAPYAFASGQTEYEPGRDRRLLLKKSEVRKLQAALAEQGVSLVPLEVRAGRHIKVVLGLGKGRKRIDKRQRIKERDMKRKIQKGQEY
ncbi:MAG: SsrA-binding protein SmpB [Candidatus Peribacteraceae bacterium]|nr:SsrA-binding protein SmpB [Candidatus Peribacteria bacterium]